MRVNCLLQNIPLVHDIRKIISVIVADRIKNNLPAKFPDIYYAIKEEGLEVDAESVGAIYNGLYGMYNEDYISSIDEVVAFAGRDVFDQMESITDAVLAGGKPIVLDELGRTSPERSAVNSIAQVFEGSTFGSSEKVKTDIRKMEDLVTRAAKSFLPKADAIKAPTMIDALNSFFKVEGHTFKRLDGGINTLETLTNAVKQEVKNYIKLIESQGKLDKNEIALLKDQWDQYTDAFINSAYDIFMNKAQQNSLVNMALQQVQLNGTNILDYNGNVKWDLVVKYGNPDTVVDSVKELFENGIKEKDGTVTKYTPLQAQRIGEYFRKLYLEKLKDAQKRALNNNRVRNNTPVNVISDFVKDEGFFNLVKDKDGALLLSQSDWENFIFEINKQVRDAGIENKNLKQELAGIDYIAVKLKNWLDAQKDANGDPKFDSYKKQVITDKIIDIIVAKLAPNTNDATDIDRLIALDTINKGNAFTAETQFAINKVVGVSGISQNVLNQLRQLTKSAAAIMNGSAGTAQVKGNTINRGAYAFQPIADIDRKIKEILRVHAISKSNQQMVVKYFSDLLGGGTVSLLLNPNNVLENPITQIGTNIAETVNMFRTNPKLARQTWWGLQETWAKAWWNYAVGGASNELANEGELSNELQSSERLRLRAWGEEFKKGTFKGIGSALIKSPQYAVSIAARFLMNSFDAATTVSLMRKRMLQTTYKTLLDQGRSPKEVRTMMADAIKLPQSTLNEIQAENQRIKQILTNAGIFVTDAMMKQNESDMFLSVYESVIQQAGVNVGATVKQATEVTRAFVESSQAQSKALGGKQQLKAEDWLSQGIYKTADALLYLQKSAFKNSKEAESRGELGKAARLQLAGSAYQTAIGKFVGGVANFMVLAISATPYGFLQGAQLASQRRKYEKKNGLLDIDGKVDVFSADPEQLRRWNLLYGQMQSIYTRAIMGSIAMGMFILRAIARDPEDEEEEEGWLNQPWLDNLMATKLGKRFVQKHLPVSLSMATAYFYGGEDEDDTSFVRTMEMFNTYTGGDFDKYQNFMRFIKKKNLSSEERVDEYTKIIGGLLPIPNYNINQPEQVTKFLDVVRSAFNTNMTSAVEFDQQLSKEIYQDAEGIIDNFLINGAIESMRRGFDNRYNNTKTEDK